jgi:hypothetical protein
VVEKTVMNQHVEFKVSYDGNALREHRMDVRDLAPALLSLGQLFDEANRVLNGEKIFVNLQIKAQEAGSFEILLHLQQSFAGQISHFLTGDFVTSVLNLKELVLGGGVGSGLLWLIRKLKGGKPTKITDLKNGMVRIEYAGESFDVPVKLLRLYQDISVRKATEEILKPLYREGIDVFQVKDNTKVIETIKKEDINYFILPELEDEKLLVSENEAAYSIIALAFKDDNKWRLYDGNSTINVTITDENFQKRVDQNIISFSKGDILRCKVRTTQWRTQNGLKTEYEVFEVTEHLPAARQLLLFDTLESDETKQ